MATAAAAGLLLPAGAAQAAVAPGFTELISVDSGGAQGDRDSREPSVSADGRYVAFVSSAGNLVPDDTNGGLDSLISGYDIFVRDRLMGTTERVSVSSNGRQADGDSGFLGNMGGPSISADGRYVAFASEATNLVSGDRNGTTDVFVHDRQTEETTRVSVATGGDETGGGRGPDISDDGRYIAFHSHAEDLVPGDANIADDIFVHDALTGTTERISQAPDGTDANGPSFFAPHISGDGSFVYFSSLASNLVPGIETDTDDTDAFLFNRTTGDMTAVTAGEGNPDSFVPTHGTADGMSNNGRYLSFTTRDDQFAGPGTDTNGFADDAWLYDLVTDTYTLVGVNDAGEQGDESTFGGDVSDDGRYVTLISRASNFGGPTDFRENVYQRDLIAGTTSLISAASDGTFGDLSSLEPSMTPDGKVTAFESGSSTFVTPDSNGASDVFVRDQRPAADLALTITDSPDPVIARQQLTYTLSVANQGPAAASGVTLTGTLPNENVLSITPTHGTCVQGKIKGGISLSCDLGTLTAGATATVTVVMVPARDGTLAASASVTADQPDSNAANNRETETTSVLPWK